MTQSAAEIEGNYPVALTGRIYVCADATKSSIKPGEMLTTSGTTGYAMKVTDLEVRLPPEFIFTGFWRAILFRREK